MLAPRRRELLDDGGHRYLYSAESLPQTKALMHETLDSWSAYVHERIDEFGD